MSIKEAIESMKELLSSMSYDLNKAACGNKTASQRVRTNSIKFGKIAKFYRKESLLGEKKILRTKASKKR